MSLRRFYTALPMYVATALPIALSACTLLAPVSVLGQSSRGAVAGNVTDLSNAIVVGVEVSLKSRTTGETQTTTTNSAGLYRFEAVLPGDYTVLVRAAGFATEESPLTVTVGSNVGRDFSLKPGSSSTVVEVSSNLAPDLQTDEAVRSSVISSVELAELPIPGQSSLNLILTAPGVARTNTGSGADNGIGSVNGSRGRSNNFLIDGLQNNDISVTGPQYSITNNDELQETSFQTSNFTAEFGRAGGAVVNQITKTGSRSIHGTIAEVYRSEVLNASTNTQRINFANGSTPVLKNKFKENIPAFTIGGPVYIPYLYPQRDRTFFFGAGQWDRYSANNAGTTFTVPTAAGYATLQALSSCPNVALYLKQLGDVRGSSGTGSANIDISVPTNLAATTCTNNARTGQVVQVGNYVRTVPEVSLDNNHLIRIDHKASEKQSLLFRWMYDNNTDNIGGTVGVNSQFDVPFTSRYMNAAFNDTYLISPRVINEFRFGYVRNKYTFFNTPGLADTLPTYSVGGVSSLTLSSTYPQGRISNSFQYQDVVSWTRGSHSFRFGVEFLRQLATQQAPYNSRGAYTFATTPVNAPAGVTTTIQSLANFIDNDGGQGGAASISIGSGRYHPNLFTWTLYAQDTWKPTKDLTVNYGLRYENFGQPANIFQYPAFTGFADADLTNTSRVNQDNNNFGPSVGFAYNPKLSGKGFLSGGTVIRGGYQVSYDTFFNNFLSNLVAGVPNTRSNAPVTSATSVATPRGYVNLTSFPFAVAPITPYTTEQNKLGKNIRNPYYHHFSLGVQQQLAAKLVLDVAYVGGLGRQLFYSNYANPAVPDATLTTTATQTTTSAGTQTLRLYPNRGIITYRASGLTSNYHSFQLQLRRQALHTKVGDLTFSSSYTYSKSMDVGSDAFASYATGAFSSRSPSVANIGYVDYGPADTDLRHISSTVVNWNLPGVHNGLLNQIVGGWNLSPILYVTSGQPYTVFNGADRDLDGTTSNDRPDIGNPNAPVNTRALTTSTANCATGYYDPARVVGTGGPKTGCVSPTDVRFVQVTAYAPTSPRMESRNSLYTTRYLDLDLNVLKRFTVGERLKFELRGEFFNITNNQNFTTPSAPSNVATQNGTNFQNFLLNNGGSRTMRVGGKVLF